MTRPNADDVRRRVRDRIENGKSKVQVSEESRVSRNALYAFLDETTEPQEGTVAKLDAWLRGVPYGTPEDVEQVARQIAASQLRLLADVVEAGGVIDYAPSSPIGEEEMAAELRRRGFLVSRDVDEAGEPPPE